jgi:hypothetical protein
MRILLDVDCVLADWVPAACRAHGLTPEAVYAVWPAGEYGMDGPLAEALRRAGRWPGGALNRDAARPFTAEDFWAPLNGSAEFWATLPKTPWCDDLVALALGLTEDVWLVSAPSRCPSSHLGKLDWVRRHFGDGFDRLVLTPHKYLLANPSAVLVDDRDDNVRAFRLAAGRATLFPAHHNRDHVYKDRPLDVVGPFLESYRRILFRKEGR